jgi:hypothetical protein
MPLPNIPLRNNETVSTLKVENVVKETISPADAGLCNRLLNQQLLNKHA